MTNLHGLPVLLIAMGSCNGMFAIVAALVRLLTLLSVNKL